MNAIATTSEAVRRIVVIALAFFALVFSFACSSTGSIIHTMPNRMEGLFLDITVKKGRDSTARYNITQDGTLSFAGGMEAKHDEFEWSTELSADQRQRVLDMVREFGWLDREPASVNENAEHTYEIALRQGSTRRKHEVQGDNPQVVQLVEFLDEICMQRFEGFMDQLPKPGQQKQ